jgi:hypothetical protein
MNLFLDDQRSVSDAYYSNYYDEYRNLQWNIARSYDRFVDEIESYYDATSKLPDLISFDYDLKNEKNGLDCARFLADFVRENNLKIPEYFVHSAWPGISLEFKNILG